MTATASLAVCAGVGQDPAQAALLASQLGLPLLAPGTSPVHCDNYAALLMIGANGLCLQQTGRPAPGPVVVDFGSPALRHRRRSGHNELLGRAVGVARKPGLRVLDATAGLGRDAFVLADLGCAVQLCEREPVIAALLRWGMDRASSCDDAWLRAVVARMSLLHGDVRELGDSLGPVDVIYLDPMFPHREKSAAVKKEMALFQLLLDDASAMSDADELLPWALGRDVARVVVKRPPRAPSLGGQAPSHCLQGKAVRYDVYVRRGLIAGA